MKILFFLVATIAILGAFEIEGGYERSRPRRKLTAMHR